MVAMLVAAAAFSSGVFVRLDALTVSVLALLVSVALFAF
jgi:hypothetical protein